MNYDGNFGVDDDGSILHTIVQTVIPISINGDGTGFYLIETVTVQLCYRDIYFNIMMLLIPTPPRKRPQKNETAQHHLVERV